MRFLDKALIGRRRVFSVLPLELPRVRITEYRNLGRSNRSGRFRAPITVCLSRPEQKGELTRTKVLVFIDTGIHTPGSSTLEQIERIETPRDTNKYLAPLSKSLSKNDDIV